MTATFTKLFQSITASTIWCEPNETRIVWITMLAMADRNGEVSGSIPGLAGIARVTVADCRKAIQTFLAPDPDSRTKEHDGRRIEEIKGGWRLLNYGLYREMQDSESAKEAKRKWWRENRSKEALEHRLDIPSETRSDSMQAEAEAEAVVTSSNINGYPSNPKKRSNSNSSSKSPQVASTFPVPGVGATQKYLRELRKADQGATPMPEEIKAQIAVKTA